MATRILEMTPGTVEQVSREAREVSGEDVQEMGEMHRSASPSSSRSSLVSDRRFLILFAGGE
jgi:hypothetical protein